MNKHPHLARRNPKVTIKNELIKSVGEIDGIVILQLNNGYTFYYYSGTSVAKLVEEVIDDKKVHTFDILAQPFEINAMQSENGEFQYRIENREEDSFMLNYLMLEDEFFKKEDIAQFKHQISELKYVNNGNDEWLSRWGVENELYLVNNTNSDVDILFNGPTCIKVEHVSSVFGDWMETPGAIRSKSRTNKDGKVYYRYLFVAYENEQVSYRTFLCLTKEEHAELNEALAKHVKDNSVGWDKFEIATNFPIKKCNLFGPRYSVYGRENIAVCYGRKKVWGDLVI